MTDEANNNQAAPAPVKRGPGRPRKNFSEREPIRESINKPMKMRAKPNWESIDPNAPDTPDRLHIDASLIPEGMSLQWVTSTVFGQDVPQHRGKFESRGWTPVHQEDFDGQFNGMFMQKNSDGEINVDGLVLMARPAHLTRNAVKRDKLKAMNEVRIKEQGLLSGDVSVGPFDPTHPSALRSNKINKTLERIEVPEE